MSLFVCSFFSKRESMKSELREIPGEHNEEKNKTRSVEFTPKMTLLI